MSIFRKKQKEVPPLTWEERRWLHLDAVDKQLAKEREMFADDETFEDFLDWRFRIKKKNWSYVPEGTGRPGILGEEWFCWVTKYFAEHPDAKRPEY